MNKYSVWIKKKTFNLNLPLFFRNQLPALPSSLKLKKKNIGFFFCKFKSFWFSFLHLAPILIKMTYSKPESVQGLALYLDSTRHKIIRLKPQLESPVDSSAPSSGQIFNDWIKSSPFGLAIIELYNFTIIYDFISYCMKIHAVYII